MQLQESDGFEPNDTTDTGRAVELRMGNLERRKILSRKRQAGPVDAAIALPNRPNPC